VHCYIENCDFIHIKYNIIAEVKIGEKEEYRDKKKEGGQGEGC
jgi:predicted nucleic acid-binding protein